VVLPAPLSPPDGDRWRWTDLWWLLPLVLLLAPLALTVCLDVVVIVKWSGAGGVPTDMIVGGLVTLLFLVLLTSAPFWRPWSRLRLHRRGPRAVGVVEEVRGWSFVYGTLLVRRSAQVRFTTAVGGTVSRRVPIPGGVEIGQVIALAYGRRSRPRAVPLLTGRERARLTARGVCNGFVVQWLLSALMIVLVRLNT
jgi:hypothetical protein